MYDAARAPARGQGPDGRAARWSATTVTSLDMAGCSLTVTALDDELRGLWDAPVHTAALRW